MLIVIPEKIHSKEIINRHYLKVQLRNTTQSILIKDRVKVLESLAADSAISNLDAVLKTTYIQNQIEEADLEIQEPLQITLTVN